MRAGLVLLALLLLIFPLRSLTNRRAAPAAGVARDNTAAPLHLTITSTTFPFRFSISHLGHVVWRGESITNSSSKDLALALPGEGIDLLVEASWAEKKETAVRLEISRAAGSPSAKTLWGTNGLNDVLTFQP